MLGAVLHIKGPAREQAFPLDSVAVCDIGRSPENLLQLEGSSVSRRHAIIHRGRDGGLTLTDLGSQNGTWINGRRITGTVALNNGDSIQMGDYTMQFRCGESRVAASSVVHQTDESTRLVVKQASATILVMDLHNYTGLSQMVDGGILSRLLGDLGNRSAAIFSRNGAWSYKTIADAVMAVWVHEAPNQPSNVGRPLRATIEVASVVQHLGGEYQIPGGLVIGAGLSTGPVSFGGLGAQGQLDVVGDTVNRAFRLEAATRPVREDVLVCEATRLAMRGAPVDLFRTHQTQLKGFSTPVRAYGLTYADLNQWLPYCAA
jgi:class 3 adenylate cyclase